MNILFVCRHNRFRSKVAEALFSKYNKNKNNKVKSCGVKHDLLYVDDNVKNVLLEYGIKKVDNTPRFIDNGLREWADRIVVVADNVTLDSSEKVEIWPVTDCEQSDKEGIKIRVEEISKRIKELILRLK